MPFCGDCGGKVAENLRFCPACGSKLEHDDDAGPIPASAPVGAAKFAAPKAGAASGGVLGGAGGGAGAGAVGGAQVPNEADLAAALKQIDDHESKTNWVLLNYGKGKNDIVYSGCGAGGIDEFRTQLKEDQIQYGVIEVVVKGDEYNPVKHLLLCWIGPQVGSGLAKARASTHRAELRAICTRYTAIAAEFQTDKLAEVTYETIAQSITRVRAVYGAAAVVEEDRQLMSRSGNKAALYNKNAKFKIVDSEQVEAGLRTVHGSQQVSWCILAYVVNAKDEVELVATGSGTLEDLRAQFPQDEERIFFTVLSIDRIQPGTNATEWKKVMMTILGSKVKPLQKARSSAQRQDVWDYCSSVIPLHIQYQPESIKEMNVRDMLAKME